MSACFEGEVKAIGEFRAEEGAEVVAVDEEARQMGGEVERGPEGFALGAPAVCGFEVFEAEAGVGQVDGEEGNGGTLARGR